MTWRYIRDPLMKEKQAVLALLLSPCSTITLLQVVRCSTLLKPHGSGFRKSRQRQGYLKTILGLRLLHTTACTK